MISKVFFYNYDNTFIARGTTEAEIKVNGVEIVKCEMEEFPSTFTFTCLMRKKKKKHLFKKFRKYTYKTNRRK